MLAASIFHYGEYTVGEAKALMASARHPGAASERAAAAATGACRARCASSAAHWKRSKLPVADRPGLRPTPDRVRETLFNWLGQDLTGWRCLDAFAGSGALGFEAASRGAAEVVLLERDAALVRALARVAASGCRPTRCASSAPTRWPGWRAAAPARFDLVLLDPPFDAGLLEPALDAARARCVAPGGFVYVEAGRAAARRRRPGLRAAPPRRAPARVHFQLLRARAG